MKCQKCGTAHDSNFCPNCGTPSVTQNNVQIQQTAPKPPIKKKKKHGCLIAIICMFAFSAVMGILFGEETPSPEDTQNNTSSISNVQTDEVSEIGQDVSQENKNEKKPTNNKEKIIYTDSDIKVSFIKVAEASEYGVNVTACYIYLKVENIGTQKYTVMLQDAYANDSAVTVMSGLPMTLEPGKNSKQPFAFGYNEILNSADEVEKLDFKIILYDDNFSTIKTTQNITVDVK